MNEKQCGDLKEIIEKNKDAAKAYALIMMTDGNAAVHTHGGLIELIFMEKVLNSFVAEVMSGRRQLNGAAVKTDGGVDASH